MTFQHHHIDFEHMIVSTNMEISKQSLIIYIYGQYIDTFFFEYILKNLQQRNINALNMVFDQQNTKNETTKWKRFQKRSEKIGS